MHTIFLFYFSLYLFGFRSKIRKAERVIIGILIAIPRVITSLWVDPFV